VLNQTHFIAARDRVVGRSAEQGDVPEGEDRRFSASLLMRLGETQPLVSRVARHRRPQIEAILAEADTGVPIGDLCRRHGMTDSTFYRWRMRYGSADSVPQPGVSDARLQRLEAENLRLRQLVSQMAIGER